MRFASEYWRNRSKQTGDSGYGRIISTSSEAFIFGSPGQPNYAAAKAGIVAMTMCAAQTLARYGVTSNVIMPRARTRMNDSGILADMFAKPEEGFDTFAPENVAPLVAYLASPKASEVNGYVMIVWGKEIKMVDAPTVETKFENDEVWTVDAIDAKVGPYFQGRTPIFGGFTVEPS
jgi:3-oxoacyl-[acyl-carrier protein] reductase